MGGRSSSFRRSGGANRSFQTSLKTIEDQQKDLQEKIKQNSDWGLATLKYSAEHPDDQGAKRELNKIIKNSNNFSAQLKALNVKKINLYKKNGYHQEEKIFFSDNTVRKVWVKNNKK